MFVDLTDKTRIKLGFCKRDFGKNIREQADAYLCEGYDAVIIAEKGIFTSGDGILPSVECKIGNSESMGGQYTIIGVGVSSNPEIPEDWENMIKTSSAKACEAIRLIHMKNGYAVLTDVKENGNTARQIENLEGLDAIDVASMGDDAHVLCDELAERGVCTAVFSTGENLHGGICVEALEATTPSIVRAITAGRFYSSEGCGEVHVSSFPSGKIQIRCTPASKIELFTNHTDNDRHTFTGDGLIGAEYVPSDEEKFIRAEICTDDGERAWTNYIEVI